MRDQFKQLHKVQLGAGYYATDIDLALVDKYPPGIVAFVDVKTLRDRVTFAECVAYDELITYAPVYIIESDSPETGPFRMRVYEGSDWQVDPPKVNLRTVRDCRDWNEFRIWENELRRAYRQKER